LKLYFVIGFPMESDADVESIADLCLRIRGIGRGILGPRAGRLQLSVSVNNFVPKPFTPFQWIGMADRTTLRRRQELLRSRLRKPGVRLALHDVDKSYLEAALARGGEEMAPVLVEAWRRGARFDSWTEQFHRDAWRQALAGAGTMAEALAATTYECGRLLPWRVVRGVVDDAYLCEEWRRAELGEATPDCREGDCGACGVCTPGIAVDVARPAAAPGDPAAGALLSSYAVAGMANNLAERAVPGADSEPPRLLRPPPGGGGRHILVFSVAGRARLIGHLDKLEVFRRAVRRAGGRLALSSGLRPKPLLSLALPLAVGTEADAELCEFELAVAPSPGFAAKLAATLPRGLQVVSLEPYDAPRHAAARVVAAEYEMEVEAPPDVDAGGAIDMAAQRFASAPSLVMHERRGGRVRDVDVRAFVDRIDRVPGASGAAVVSFRTAVTPMGLARPERVVEALAELSGIELKPRRITRKKLVLE
jgi:radical SAM-linked protein